LPRPVGAPRKYPWELWLDGDSHTIAQGSDFTSSTNSFRLRLYRVAYRNGLGVSVHIVSSSVLSFSYYPLTLPLPADRESAQIDLS
jgi:hypothetical protein